MWLVCVPGSPRLGPARAYLLQRAPCPSCDLASSRRAQSAPSLCVLFVFSPSHVLLLFILKGFWTCRHIRVCQSIPVYSLPQDLTQVSREPGTQGSGRLLSQQDPTQDHRMTCCPPGSVLSVSLAFAAWTCLNSPIFSQMPLGLVLSYISSQ